MARSRSFDLLLRRQPAPALSTLGVAIATVALVLAGCDSGTQEPDAPSPEAVEYTAPGPATAADEPPASPSASTPAEMPEGFRAEIPTVFPSDVPLPEDAVPVLGQGGVTEDSERSGVQLSTSKSPAEILSFYEGEFASGGWSIGEEPTREGAMTATRGDTTVMFFVVESPNGGSDIYMITEKMR